MDKRSLLGFAIIMVIVTAWMLYNSVNQKPEPQQAKDSTNASSTFSKEAEDSTNNKSIEENKAPKNDSASELEKYGMLDRFSTGNDEYITIENDLVKILFSRKGACIQRYTLKNYKSWNGFPTQLIWNNGELYLSFLTKDNKKIDSRDMYFSLDNNGNNHYRLKGDQTLTLTARLDVGKDTSIVETFKFYGNQYIFDMNVTLNNMDNIIPTRGYNFVWSDGLRYQEKSSVDESNEALAMASLGGEIEELNASKDEPKESSLTGNVDFIACKTKYFGVAIKPYPENSFDGTVDMLGSRYHAKNEGLVERYTISYRCPYRNPVQQHDFRVYVGPLEYDNMKRYGLANMMNLGWRWIIRPIGEYFMLPIFLFIHKFIPNFGIAIIVFSILMKILLHPLSIKQLRSAQRMKLLTPEITKIREKFPDDNQAQQKETMKLYSEHGINPMGGCLPMLLQMPILYALWAVLRVTIDLRQAPFFGWISDLSLPDTIYTLPFSFLGIKQLSGLALLMGVTMFIQQKMTVTDPRQKGLVYMMPVMFTLMFSNFPSGLNLYYFMFNLMSIVQQYYITNLSRKRLSLEQLRKLPKKEGWLQKKMRDAQEIAESRGKSLPSKYSDSLPKRDGSPKGSQRKRPNKKGKR
jgi:YidC/Oxa1 family membrane protein insertase